MGCNSLVYVVHRVEFAETDGLFRLISLKHEFPTAIHQLLNPSSEMQSTEFELDRKHFPYFVIDKDLTLTLVKIYLKPKGKESLDTTGLRLKINNIDVGIWDSVAGTNMKVSNVALAGSPNPVMKWSINSGVNGLDKEKLDDIR